MLLSFAIFSSLVAAFGIVGDFDAADDDANVSFTGEVAVGVDANVSATGCGLSSGELPLILQVWQRKDIMSCLMGHNEANIDNGVQKTFRPCRLRLIEMIAADVATSLVN